MADPTAILADLVRRPSVNPMGRDLVGPEYLEGRVTDYLLRRLETAGIAAVRQPVAAGRDNVIARLPATVADAPVLIWDVHQDTVPVSGMTIEPFTPTVRDGRLAGRGACDVKGGMAAMVAALERLQTAVERRATVIFVASVNEEFGFSGAHAFTRLLRTGAPDARLPTDRSAADLIGADVLGSLPVLTVVAEPTRLAMVTQHKGAVRWRMIAGGRACHSSHPEDGANAIYPAARAAVAVEQLATELLTRQAEHPCGPPTLSIGTIHGGTGVNLVPDRVVLEIDRRLVPGEDPVAARQEVIDVIQAACSGDEITHEPPFLESGGLSCAGQAAATAADLLAKAIHQAGFTARQEAARYGTNACVYAAAGLACVVFGPGSIAQAHTADEWIELSQVEAVTEILTKLVTGGD
jgi:acetylornithine deacetylase/succinyl-diaminopimelate desuccinylase-like protein